MQFQTSKAGAVQLTDLDEFLAELLRLIPMAASPDGHDAAMRRLFPRPTDDPDACSDWEEYVVPDLESHFEYVNDVVRDDLAALGTVTSEPPEVFEIHPDHFDAWLSALNQARLVLSERFDLGENDMDEPFMYLPDSPRAMAKLQVHFYAVLQECLIHAGWGDSPDCDEKPF